MRKLCSRCQRVRLTSLFYRDARKADGLYPHCKECHQGYTRRWEHAHHEQYRESQRLLYWKNPEKRKAQGRAYRQRQDAAAVNRKRRQKHAAQPYVVRARKLACYAIARGYLVRKPCEVCGTLDVHAHHDDYAKPLTVRWLCPMHHRRHHAGVAADAPCKHG